MRSLLAHIAEPLETAERRRTERRTLRLDVAARSSTEESAVIIRDLSRTGLLIETDTSFVVGETFLLVLPELGATPARIIRADGNRFGCEFLSPVPASAISAALLKAPYTGEAAEIAEAAFPSSDYEEIDVRRPTSAVLFTALTALLSIAALLFVFALVSLSFS